MTCMVQILYVYKLHLNELQYEQERCTNHTEMSYLKHSRQTFLPVFAVYKGIQNFQ